MGKKCGCLWRRGKVVCWIMMSRQKVRQWERRHLYSKVALPVPLHSILKRWICCCYLYLWIHAIWPSVRWWVIPMQQEELVVNLQSATSAPSLTCYSTPGSAEYGWRWREGGWYREQKDISLSEVPSFTPTDMSCWNWRRWGAWLNGYRQRATELI